MLRLFVVLLVSMLSGLALTAAAEQPLSAEEVAVRSLEERERLAVLEQDVAALEQLWAEQYIVNNPLGQISPDRDSVLERVRRGLISYSKFERQIEAVRINGDIAIVMGSETVEPKNTAPGAPQAAHRRFTNVWQRTGTTWRTIARHANVIPGK